MSSSMKYLGAATDPGEWWCDRESTATDMGPGVSISVRCGEDGGSGPYVVCCYGYREDVNLPAVHHEIDRIVAAYQQPNGWYPAGRKLQGPIRYPSIERWQFAGEILGNLKEENIADAIRAAHPRGWVLHWVLRDRWEDIAQCKYLSREEIVAAMIPPAEVQALWPYVAIGHDGKPEVFRRCPEIEPGTFMEQRVAYVRKATPEDWVVA